MLNRAIEGFDALRPVHRPSVLVYAAIGPTTPLHAPEINAADPHPVLFTEPAMSTMTPAQRLDRVRQHLLAMPQTGDAITGESIVIGQEMYLGRRFEMAEHRAIWFAEEDCVKVYRRGGGHVLTMTPEDLDQVAAVQSDANGVEQEVVSLPMFSSPESEETVRRAA